MREKKKEKENGFCVGSATDRSRELGIITIIVSWAFGGALVTRAKERLFSVTKKLHRGRSAASSLRPLLSNPCMISYLTRGGKKSEQRVSARHDQDLFLTKTITMIIIIRGKRKERHFA